LKRPPLSPHQLIQEKYWPDEWKILICCLLLNQTSRKQLDQVVETFFEKYPNADSLLSANLNELKNLIRPLGMYNRRANTLIRFSNEYLDGNWISPKDLYGCGKYADDAWRIFCKGEWNDVKPNDHALNDYHSWLKREFSGEFSYA